MKGKEGRGTYRSLGWATHGHGVHDLIERQNLGRVSGEEGKVKVNTDRRKEII